MGLQAWMVILQEAFAEPGTSLAFLEGCQEAAFLHLPLILRGQAPLQK